MKASARYADMMLSTAESGKGMMTTAVRLDVTQDTIENIKLCIECGYSERKTAEKLGINRGTLRKWKQQYSEIRRLYEPEEVTDEEKVRQVEEALLKRAIGYTQTEITRQIGKDGKLDVVKTVEKQVMPSTTAQIFWLKNRCGYEWDGNVPQDGEEESERGIVVLPEREEMRDDE